MAVTSTSAVTALGTNLIVDFDADTTEENNVTGNSSGTIFLIQIDNTANATTGAYVRIRDAASADNTNNTTGVPTWIFYAAPGATARYVMPLGTEYSAGVSLWCTTSNAANNNDAPGSAVIVKLIAS
jgi:hypothetical protein